MCAGMNEMSGIILSQKCPHCKNFSRSFHLIFCIIFRWNQLDLAIVLLSIMGITLEEIEVNASLPINPTIIRIMRVLRIARGQSRYFVLGHSVYITSDPRETEFSGTVIYPIWYGYELYSKHKLFG